MKFDELRSIGHNIADSLASGVGLLIGVYDFDVFDEVRLSAERFIEVDFLTGASLGCRPSLALARVITLYYKALPSLCEKHGTSSLAFQHLSTRYCTNSPVASFTVTVEDQNGHHVTDEYAGRPGSRLRLLDPLGRVRSKRAAVTHRLQG